MKKVTIIEDDIIFGEKLRKKLTQQGYDVTWHQRCEDAYSIANSTDIDILLLDLNLGENSILHGEGILSILKNKAIFPVIVMTAYDERITQLFEYNVFTVFRKPVEISLLIHTIQNAIKLNELQNRYHKADYAIITALFEDEFENVRNIFKLDLNEGLKLGSKNVYSGSLKNFPNKKVIGLYQSETGRTDSSNLVTEIIKEYNPKFIFMTGVCGGQNVSLGDIIIAKFVFTFDKGKITDYGFLREIELVKIDENLIRKIRENNHTILAEVKKKLKSTKFYNKYKDFNFDTLNSFIDPMACSSAVIDKENYFTEVIKSVERKATAVEMESYGFARAAETTNSGLTKSLIIKSVMDNTVGKNDKAKAYASFTSAIFLKTLLEMGIIE